MKFPSPVSLSWIATLIDAEVIGNANAQATGINEIHRVEKGDLAFVDHPKYYDTCLKSNASFIIINNKDVAIPEGKALLFTHEPFEAYLKIANHFRPFIPSTKIISDTAVIGKNTVIMPNAFIGNHVTIGDNCVIYPNATISDYTQIGNNVVIQSGTVIGGDAFYYNSKKNREVWFKKMRSCGDVVIEDNVEIGCNCTIDRGATASTIIGKGTIIDNLVHLAHDVEIGKNCLIAAQTGIAGYVVVEDGVTILGQVGIGKTLRIGKNAVLLSQAGVTNHIEGNKTYWGTPAVDSLDKRKELVWIKRLPELWKKVMES
jgi:UDP-3-O-[3-hydroxymyristoyl] glucosamine N-acyltransferase